MERIRRRNGRPQRPCQVVEQITPRYNVTRTENGVKDLSAGTDGTVFGSELFEVTGTFNANMGWGDFVKIKTIGDARESKALLGAATSMAEKIDAYILAKGRQRLGRLDRHAANVRSSEWVDAAAAIPASRKTASMTPSFRISSTYGRNASSATRCVKLPAPDASDGTLSARAFRASFPAFGRCSPTSFPCSLTGTRAADGRRDRQRRERRM
jgi:hypothetical protein